MKLELPYLEYEQPIGTFYMTVIEAETLLRIVEVRRRGETYNGYSLWNDKPRSMEEGVQRKESTDRVNKISKYCEDPDATFPTPIIISIYSGVNVEDRDHKFIFNIREEERIGDVIDGQHRLMGIAKSGYGSRFKLPVALMFNMNVEEKAYVFSTINSTQTDGAREIITSPLRTYITITDDVGRVRDVAHGAVCGVVYAPNAVSVAEEVAADHTRDHTGSGTDWD